MKHWIQWVSLTAILLFVITACFIWELLHINTYVKSQTDPATALPQSTDRLLPNDGSSYSLLHHKQEGNDAASFIARTSPSSASDQVSPSTKAPASSSTIALTP